MSGEIEAKRISGRTLFKLLFVGLLVVHVSITLVVMLLTVMGVLPLESIGSESQTTTLIGFLGAYLILGILLSPLWVCVAWLSIWPGLWLYSLLRPMSFRYVGKVSDTRA